MKPSIGFPHGKLKPADTRTISAGIGPNLKRAIWKQHEKPFFDYRYRNDNDR